MKVYIAQLKCPNNRCVIAAAAAYETPEKAQGLEPLVMAQIREMVAKHKVRYECGLYFSTRLQVEIQPTIFRSMEEAWPHLRAAQFEQVMTAQALRQSLN
jgi:hypothetical protein